ncbi:hypothetical protein [Paucibacter soli]|uniref:hypothetical protein n=1 Tax=Paucibacter soli TaxID=3133433 RepID=UPI00309FD719
MFDGDARVIGTEQAIDLLREAGWQVRRTYKFLRVEKGDRSWQLAYASPTSISVWRQDVEDLIDTTLCKVAIGR